MGAVWVCGPPGDEAFVLELGPEVGELRRTFRYGEETAAPAFSRMQSLTVGDGFVWALDAAAGSLWRIDPRAEPVREGLNGLSLAFGSDAVWYASSSGSTKIDAATGLVLGSGIVRVPRPSAKPPSVALGADVVCLVASSRPGPSSRSTLRPSATSETFTVGRGPQRRRDRRGGGVGGEQPGRHGLARRPGRR